MTLLVIQGIEIPPSAQRGITQSLDPIPAAAQMERTINAELVDISNPAFRKFQSTVTCRDFHSPSLSGVWPGQVVTVECIAHLTGTPIRPVAEQWVYNGITFYRPILQMLVRGYNVDWDEWEGYLGWTLHLEEK